jgi:hypothetical protein
MFKKTAVYSCFISLMMTYSVSVVFANDDADFHLRHRDFAAAVGSGGIDLYATSNNGVALVQGSPFVPNPVFTGIGGDPVPMPADVVMDSPRQHVYARYDATFSGHPDQLWSFRVTERGLVQEDSTIYPYGGEGEHFTPFVQFIGATEHFLYLTNFNNEVSLEVIDLYSIRDGHFHGRATIDLHTVAGPNKYVFSFPTAIHIDTFEHFLFACYSNGEEIQSTSGYSLSPPAVAVFDIKESTPTLIAHSIDSEYVGAQCP